jgi:phage tail sheath protein FI
VFLHTPREYLLATNIDTYYGVFTSAASAAIETVVKTIRSVFSVSDDKACAYTLIDAAIRTYQAVASTGWKHDSPT